MNSLMLDDRINILFVVNTLQRRGAEQQLFSFIKELPPQINIGVFRFSADKSEFPEFCNYSKIKIISNKYRGSYNFLRFLPLYDCLSKGDYNIVITLGLGTALLLGRICAFLCGIKIIYSILNTYKNFNKIPLVFDDYFDLPNMLINKFSPMLFRKRILRFLPNSNKLSAKIKSNTALYSVETLYNGLSNKDFTNLCENNPAKNIQHILDKILGYPTIVQVGAVDKNKNQIFTLNCIKDLKKVMPDIRFLVIGDGNKKSELDKYAIANNLRENIIFAGNLDRNECLYLMNKSDLIVLTSNSESFPNVLVEGHALSLPVVAFDVGAVPEIVENGVTGYIVPKGDSAKFKKKITLLLKNPSIGIRMGKMGKKKVFGRFSMENKIKRFLFLLDTDIKQVKKKLQIQIGK
jgi:glycosyltransferase involved in cell wall biosynthesis